MTKLRIRRLLVAGGAGFLGAAFVRDRLRADPEIEITVVDALRRPGAQQDLEELLRDQRLQLVQGDAGDRPTVEPLAAKADAIVNFATEEFVGEGRADGQAFVHTDIGGTVTLLDAARKYRLQRFLLVSSAEVYGPVKAGPHREEDPVAPTTLAAAARAAAELLAQNYQATTSLPVVITRAACAYGPRQPLDQPVGRMIASALLDRPLASEGGDASPAREYLHADDQASALARALWKGEAGRIYNIGNGQVVSASELAERILRLADKPLSLKRSIKDGRWSYAIDSRRMRPLGWEPRYGLDDGLRMTIDWYRRNPSWWELDQAA